ncbi:hypothetical protein EIP86_007767 [Pleurotus ostreatoroseus]|nr:hypothetical protein EIP86_007767 [Pleurotus ostreatoroseus]
MTGPRNNLSARNDATPDSPGSSIFDLPTQPGRRTNVPTPASVPADHENAADHSLSRLAKMLIDTESSASAVPSCIVVSGGTGCNAICAAFGDACYVLPVSDDGGSSSEIIRVLGGPSIGDIRSRLVRLIPPAPPSSPLDCIKNLLAYRLPARCTEREARDEWRDIVEGRSSLWSGIPNDRKELIRGFLVYFENQVLKRAHKNFSFLNGSVGNYFLAAAQEFFRSLPSAIFLFSSITNSQDTCQAHILPVIVTNHTVTIAAELENGARLVGQCEISHPVRGSGVRITLDGADGDGDPLSPMDDMHETIAKPNNVLFEASKKDEYEPLDARISRLFYINAYGNEIHPSPNQEYITNLANKEVLVYSCGSLWTSVMPCLALRGVANAIARSRSLRAKVLLLNSQNDRETDRYNAEDYIKPYRRYYGGIGDSSTTYPVSAFITHMLYLKGTLVPVDLKTVTALGVKCVEVEGVTDEKTAVPKFSANSVRRAIVSLLEEETTPS